MIHISQYQGGGGTIKSFGKLDLVKANNLEGFDIEKFCGTVKEVKKFF